MLIDNSSTQDYSVVAVDGTVFFLPSASSDLTIPDGRYLTDQLLRAQVNLLYRAARISVNNPPAGFPLPDATDQSAGGVATLPADLHAPDASETALALLIDDPVVPGGVATLFVEDVSGTPGQLGAGQYEHFSLTGDAAGAWPNAWTVAWATQVGSPVSVAWDDTAHTATILLEADTDGNVTTTYNDLLLLGPQTHSFAGHTLALTQVMTGVAQGAPGAVTPLLYNTFEAAVTSGTTITTGNSGTPAGNAFDAVLGPNPPAYADTPTATSGVLVMKPSTLSQSQVGWNASLSTPTVLYKRFYLYLEAAPGALTIISNMRDQANANNLQVVRVTTTRQLQVATIGFPAKITTNTLPLNQWVRVEARFEVSGGNLQSTLRYYADPDSSTPTETLTDVAHATAATAFGAARFGPTSAYGAQIYLNDVAVATADWVGPALSFTQPVPVEGERPVDSSTFSSEVVLGMDAAPEPSPVFSVEERARFYPVAGANTPLVRVDAQPGAPSGAVILLVVDSQGRTAFRIDDNGTVHIRTGTTVAADA